LTAATLSGQPEEQVLSIEVVVKLIRDAWLGLVLREGIEPWLGES
jgi:hypothetical protein